MATATRERPLILVVDDFEDGRDLLCEILLQGGFDVDDARDGLEALVKVEQRLPDLVMMDLSLPGVDGWEVTRRIKSDPTTRRVRVVAFTAHALAEPARRALDAGCEKVLTKPCAPAQVLTEVRALLASPTKTVGGGR